MMEFPRWSIMRLATSLCCFSVLLSFTTMSAVVVAAASETCEFPAIFNFGDSNSDTGGYAAAFSQPPSPNGRTFFGKPAGRFSDGRLVIDFIADSFGLPFLSAYLDSVGSNYTHGANFATAASTIRLPTRIIPAGRFSPFYLDLQHVQFLQFKNRSLQLRQRGGVYKDLMPKDEYFPKALYTFDMGQNDLGEGFFGNMSIEEVNASVPSIIAAFSTNVKRIYKLGGRSFWIHNTGPIGCLPYILANFEAAGKRDGAGCSAPHNGVAQYFNHKLKEAVTQLREDLPSAAITYVDVYSVKYSLFSHPKRYGFELPLVSCCGHGGEYNYSNEALCGRTMTVNGSRIFVGSCELPSVRVNWDGVHYTEAANEFVFHQIRGGAFSDPPLPLRVACHRA